MGYEKLKECGIVPVVKLNAIENAVPLAKALLAGGIQCMEITFRTAVAAECIAAVSEQVPDIYVGAGTVINTEQFYKANAAGAQFIVSPGLDIDVIKAVQFAGLDVIPGVVTPSEVIAAIKLGITTLKFFPAENYGGLKTLKALCAPFNQVNFVPTGGVNENNVKSYFEFPKVLAVGGSWMVREDDIDAGNFDKITEISKKAVELFKSVRG